jgi:lipid-A-disaccharide synthase
LESKKPIIALLPGSRLQEIKKMLPLFIEVAKHFSDYQFVIAAAPGLSIESYEPYIKNSSLKIIQNATYSLLQHSSAALVTSGTATLETALFDVPQLVCYRSSAFSYWIAKKIVKLNYISLVNLILDRLVVKELIQDALNLSNLCTHLQQLLNPAQQRKLKQDYKELKSILGNGGASNKTAQLIFTAISKDKI